VPTGVDRFLEGYLVAPDGPQCVLGAGVPFFSITLLAGLSHLPTRCRCRKL